MFVNYELAAKSKGLSFRQFCRLKMTSQCLRALVTAVRLEEVHEHFGLDPSKKKKTQQSFVFEIMLEIQGKKIE